MEQSVGGGAAVRMFGPLRLDVSGASLGPRDLGGPKPKQLLELLLLDRGRPVPKDRLADGLWGENLPLRVAATIETYVSLLRRRLDAEPGLGRRLIGTAYGGYVLHADAVDTDVDRFDALVRAASTADPAQRRHLLQAAVDLAQDDLLADEPYAAWVEAPREHYRARQLQALVDLAECCASLGDHQAALNSARRALALDPVNERAYRTVMRAQAALGEVNAALQAYARCRTVLADTLGAPPAPRTVELHAALLAKTPQQSQARPPIRYAGGIAYQVVGDGPLDLVFVPSFVTNLGATWDDPTYAGFLRRLASSSRLILFDKRGTGLSDPALDFPTTQQRSDDLVHVLDAARSPRAVLFGVCGGGALCAHFAADHPSGWPA